MVSDKALSRRNRRITPPRHWFGQSGVEPCLRPLLRGHEHPQDRVNDDLAARDHQQDQDEQDPGRPRRQAKAATQAGAHPSDHPTLARPDQALTPKVVGHVPQPPLPSPSIPPAQGQRRPEGLPPGRGGCGEAGRWLLSATAPIWASKEGRTPQQLARLSWLTRRAASKAAAQWPASRRASITQLPG